MRISFACVSLLGLAAVGCVDVEFSTGGQGGSGSATGVTGATSSGSASGGASSVSAGSGGAVSTTSGAGGSGTTTSTTSTTTTTSTTSTTTGGGGDCTNKRCGDDGNGGLCNGVAMQDQWGASLPGEALAIVPWPETQSVFVATANDTIVRVDECDGSIMATQPDVSTTYNRPVLFGLGFDGGSQLMAIGGSNTDLGNSDRRFYLDPTTLAVTSSDLLANEFGNGGGGAFADASGVWVNLKEGGQGHVPFGGNECSEKFAGYGTLQGRGVVKTATGLYALKWDTGSFRTTVLGSLGACSSTCTCPDPVEQVSAVGVLDNDIVDTGAELVAVGTSSMTDARLIRLNPSTLAAIATLEFDVNNNGQDALLTAHSQGGFVYTGGAAGLAIQQAYARGPTGGTAVLLRVPTGFTGSTTPVVVNLTGGARVRDLAGDATGIYAGGAKTTTGGFLVKCTTAPNCGAIP